MHILPQTTEYRFSRDQLQALLAATIDMYDEYLYMHKHMSPSVAAIAEMLEGLDAERELIDQGDLARPTLQVYAGREVTP